MRGSPLPAGALASDAPRAIRDVLAEGWSQLFGEK
jgi:hypothetical protein